MTASTSLEKQRRRRYDAPARLSLEESAIELQRLTRASLLLARRIMPKPTDQAVAGPKVRAKVEVVVTDIDALRLHLTTLLQSRTAAGAALPGPRSATEGASAKDGGIVAEMASRGELVEPTEFAKRMGWTRQALSKALLADRVFYVEHGGVRLYPAFFAERNVYGRAALEQVSKALDKLPGGAKLQFFLSRRGSLGGESVLEALAKGRVSQVLAAAQAYVQG